MDMTWLSRLGSDPSTNRAAAGSRIALRLLLLCAIALGATLSARADFPGDIPDRFKIQAGGYSAAFVTQGSLGRTDGAAGVFVNFEDVFDLPVSDSAWTVEGVWRFSERGYVDFGYVQFHREAAHVLEEDIDWGDATFQADARVDAKFGTDFPYAAYRHDFLHLEQVHISGSAGISYLRLESGLAAQGGVVDPNGTAINGHFEANANVSFPVPMLGLQVDWKLTKHTDIQLYFRTLRVNANDFQGGITQSVIRYEWYPARHFGFGGGLTKHEINIRKYVTDDKTARFNYLVSGLEFYLKLAF